MLAFDIVFQTIRLRIECSQCDAVAIAEHLNGFVTFETCRGEPNFTLIINNPVCKKSGVFIKIVDKWFDNATAKCYLDVPNGLCFINNIEASNEENKKMLLQYFVANLFNRFLEIEGYIGIHSSCVEKDGKGIVFIGGRNSGKTICMLNMMHYGYNVVTNDKSALTSNGLEISAYGIAQSISVRMSKVFREQECNQKYAEYARKKGFSFADENMVDGNNMTLSTHKLARINNVKLVAKTNVKLIVCPKYSPDLTKVNTKCMTNQEIETLLREQDMPLVHETKSFFRMIKPEKMRNYNFEKVMTDIKKLPIISCEQGEHTLASFCETIDKLVL